LEMVKKYTYYCVMMSRYAESHKMALISTLEVVLMNMGNVKYLSTIAKLKTLYDIDIRECYDHPDYLKTVLKEVYTKDYEHIISEVKSRLDILVDTPEIEQFFKIMES